MHTDIDWEIQLEKEKNAIHTLYIEISEYKELEEFDLKKQFLSVSFPTQNRVDFISASARDEPYEWTRKSTKGEITFTCSLDIILNKYYKDTSDKITTIVTFRHDEAFSELDGIFFYYFSCNARSLWARTIKVYVSIPLQKRAAYFFEKWLKKILKINYIIGAYKIFPSKGLETSFQLESRNPSPVIKFQSRTQNIPGPIMKDQPFAESFPIILFLFQNLLNTTVITLCIIGLLSGILVSAIGSVIALLISGTL